MKWKTIATILFVLLVLENAFIAWGLVLVDREEKQTNNCYYNVCADYPQADYNVDTGVCQCYDYDGKDWSVEKTMYLPQ